MFLIARRKLDITRYYMWRNLYFHACFDVLETLVSLCFSPYLDLWQFYVSLLT